MENRGRLTRRLEPIRQRLQPQYRTAGIAQPQRPVFRAVDQRHRQHGVAAVGVWAGVDQLSGALAGVAWVAWVIGPDASWGPLIPALFVYGIGVGLATAQLTGVVLADVPVTEGGQASGTQSTARQLGAALGIAILGTVLFTTTATALATRLDDRGIPADQRDQVVSAVVDSAGGAIAGLEQSPETAPLADDAKAALSDGTKWASITAAGFLAFGLLATLSLGSGRRPDHDDEAAAPTEATSGAADGAASS